MDGPFYDLLGALSPVELKRGIHGDVVNVVIEAVVEEDGCICCVVDVDGALVVDAVGVNVDAALVVDDDGVGDVIGVSEVDVVGVNVVGRGVGGAIVVGRTRVIRSAVMIPRMATKPKPMSTRKAIWILLNIKSLLNSLIALAYATSKSVVTFGGLVTTATSFHSTAFIGDQKTLCQLENPALDTIGLCLSLLSVQIAKSYCQYKYCLVE